MDRAVDDPAEPAIERVRDEACARPRRGSDAEISMTGRSSATRRSYPPRDGGTLLRRGTRRPATTRRAPARRSARAHADAVAPVVTTSSTRRTQRPSTRGRARHERPARVRPAAGRGEPALRAHVADPPERPRVALEAGAGGDDAGDLVGLVVAPRPRNRARGERHGHHEVARAPRRRERVGEQHPERDAAAGVRRPNLSASTRSRAGLAVAQGGHDAVEVESPRRGTRGTAPVRVGPGLAPAATARRGRATRRPLGAAARRAPASGASHAGASQARQRGGQSASGRSAATGGGTVGAPPQRRARAPAGHAIRCARLESQRPDRGRAAGGRRRRRGGAAARSPTGSSPRGTVPRFVAWISTRQRVGAPRRPGGRRRRPPRPRRA